MGRAVAVFSKRFARSDREQKLSLLRHLRAKGSPPNRYAVILLFLELRAHYPIDTCEHADLVLALAKAYRDQRRFTEALTIADEVKSQPELQRNLRPWQKAAMETVASYALSRLGDYHAAADRLQQAHARWPTATVLEEGVRLHCARDPARAIAFAEERGVAKLRRRPFYLYMSALERLGLNENYDAVLTAKLRSKSKRREFVLLQANAALRDGDDASYDASMRQYFSYWGLRFPRFYPNQNSLPVLPPPTTSVAHSEAPAPTLSVIMTTYNSHMHLPFSAASLLAQSFFEFELIIVDDQSNDNGDTWRALEDLAARDGRIRLFQQKRNAGTYAAKNHGIRQARGQFITCHDSDDFALPDRFAREVARFEGNAGRMAVQSAWLRIMPSGRVVTMRWGAFLHENPASLMFRREVINDIGLFDEARTGADTEFRERLRVFYGTRAIAYVNEPLTLGLFRENSLTTKGPGGFDEDLASSERISYWERWTKWHEDCVCRNAIKTRLPLRDSRLPVFHNE